MIPPYFLTERLRLRFFPINWNATFCINYLIISLLEESKLENLPDSKSSNCKRLRIYTIVVFSFVRTFAP